MTYESTLRKTARVSFIVEYEAGDYPSIAKLGAALVEIPAGIQLVHDSVGIVVHHRPLRALSRRELTDTLAGIEARGGSFMKALGAALIRSDSSNVGRITDEFWNELCNYLPEQTTCK